MKNNQLSKINTLRLALLAFGIGTIFLIFSPWIFTLPLGYISFNAATGAIGDTIGGITAPIASLIGSILVFLALIEQVKANRIIYDEFEKNDKEGLYNKLSTYVSEQIKMFRQDLKEFSFITIHHTGEGWQNLEFEGEDAVLNALINNESAAIKRLEMFLKRLLYLLNKCDQSNLSPEDADYLRDLILMTYEHTMQHTFDAFEPKRESKTEGGITESLYELYDSLNEKKNIHYSK